MSVEPLRKDGLEVLADGNLPGIDVGYSFQIDTNRAISIRTAFGRDASGALQERILARIFSVCSVMALREKVIEAKREQTNAALRLSGKTESPDAVRIAELEAEISDLRKEQGEHYEAEKAKFYNSGRSGTFTIAGAAKSRQTAFVTDIERRAKEISDIKKKVEEDRKKWESAIRNYTVTIENAEAEIAIRREAYGE